MNHRYWMSSRTRASGNPLVTDCGQHRMSTKNVTGVFAKSRFSTPMQRRLPSHTLLTCHRFLFLSLSRTTTRSYSKINVERTSLLFDLIIAFDYGKPSSLHHQYLPCHRLPSRDPSRGSPQVDSNSYSYDGNLEEVHGEGSEVR